jgi:ferredoxin
LKEEIYDLVRLARLEETTQQAIYAIKRCKALLPDSFDEHSEGYSEAVRIMEDTIERAYLDAMEVAIEHRAPAQFLEFLKPTCITFIVECHLNSLLKWLDLKLGEQQDLVDILADYNEDENDEAGQ